MIPAGDRGIPANTRPEVNQRQEIVDIRSRLPFFSTKYYWRSTSSQKKT